MSLGKDHYLDYTMSLDLDKEDERFVFSILTNFMLAAEDIHNPPFLCTKATS